MKFILYVFLLLPVAAAAQWQVKGQVVDQGGTSLPSATVILLDATDSSRTRVTASDAEGRFVIGNIPTGSWLVKVTFLGYRPATLPVEGTSGRTVNLGKITLYPDSVLLREVTIDGERIPVVLKKDTIEYNAQSFKTRHNAAVEELLQKIPGIMVERDGSITAQGEEVKSVTVDGKKFFGRDPKLATQNLPADAIAKVQVIDRKSEQAQFSGINDGKEEKAINLVLKEDRKNGVFGNAVAGVGHPGRWQAKANLNRFSEDNQLSFLGMANNTNQQGFSMDEYLLYSGAARQMAGGGRVRFQVNAGKTNGVPLNFGNSHNGLMTSYAGGVNINHQAGKNTAVNASYFLNQLDHTTTRAITRENFQPDPENNFDYLENSTSENMNIRNRGNVTIDHTLDSANSIRFNGNFVHNTTRTSRQNNSTIQKADGTIQGGSDQYHEADIEAFNWAGNVLYRHTFEKDGRTFSANMAADLNRYRSDGILTAHNRFYGLDTANNFIDQRQKQSSLTRNLSATLSYTEPLGKRSYLEAKYAIGQKRDEVDRGVYGIEGDSLIFDTSLSNIYHSDYLFQRGGINLQRNGDGYNFMAGVAMQWSTLKGFLEIPVADVHSSFSYLLPVARFNYRISPHKRLRVDYETSVIVPAIEQLQPVADNSDPLHIYTGNPDLDPEYKHNLRFSYRHFNPSKFIGFLSFMDVIYTENAITNAQTTDAQFIRYTTPVNLKDALSIRANATLTFPLKKINSKFDLGATITDNHSVHLLNGIENSTRQSTLGFNLRYNYSFKTLVDLTLSALINHQLSRYEIDQPSQAFRHQAYSAETILNFLKNYQFTAGFEFLTYGSSGFSQEIPLLDLSVSRMMLKNKALEVKLSTVNLLNTDTGVTQDAAVNYLERQVTNSLGRYYMLSLTYTINKALNPMKARKGNGMKILRHK